jgi:flagellar FliL protein
MAENTEEAPKPQSGRNRTLMMAGGAIALLLAGAGGGYLGRGILEPAAAVADAEGGEAKAEGGEAKAEGGEAKAEGHGEAKAEGGEAKAEGGHGEAKAEAKAEGHGAPAGGHGGTAPVAAGASAVATLPNGRVITNLKTFVVNLRSSGGGRVLRLEIQVESAGDVAPALEVSSPKVRDTVIAAISDYTFTELEGTDGKTRLRDELLTRINGVMAPMTIDAIYFTQFVVQ